MNKFEVCMTGCFIQPPLPASTVLVCSNIVTPSLFNEKRLPIIGVYSSLVSDIKRVYLPLAMDTIYVVTCSLLDVTGAESVLESTPLIALHFREKQ